MSKQDTFGDRMKRYESTSEHYLMRRTPVIIRIDGKAFHTLTAKLKDRFDPRLHYIMINTMRLLCENIQGAILGYTQSDEISILLRDWDSLHTEAWFDYRQNKIESVAASMATAYFNKLNRESSEPLFNVEAMFDARSFNLPREEIVNYFWWRQSDAERNSIQTYAREFFSHKQVQNKNCKTLVAMIDEKIQSDQSDQKSWQQIDTWKKRGTCWVNPLMYKDIKNVRFNSVTYDGLDKEIPCFKDDREYIESIVSRTKETVDYRVQKCIESQYILNQVK